MRVKLFLYEVRIYFSNHFLEMRLHFIENKITKDILKIERKVKIFSFDSAFNMW